MSQAFVVVAPDTDAGKTWITAHLLKVLLQNEPQTMVMKPVQTGAIYNGNKRESEDINTCIEISGIHIPESINGFVVPYLFDTPCSPHLASNLDKQEDIVIENITTAAQKLTAQYKVVLIETAGGIYSPINQRETNMDLLQALQLPVIVVSPNKLGAISQTLSTIELLRIKKVPIAAVVLNDLVATTDNTEAMILENNCDTIRSFASNIPLYRVPFTKETQETEKALTPLTEQLLP